jgi:hypothetical protein
MNNYTYPTCFGILVLQHVRFFFKTYMLVVSYFVHLLVDVLIVGICTL